ncbi:neprilysin-1 [Drosophila eugracilis]|uniref:neprilysin-1 n=1 Tax=Drosophila eugracilis TaxID=29029 RepID=UPI001BD963C4|nr:neprilysin-1 [Drosophila eugracilis]
MDGLPVSACLIFITLMVGSSAMQGGFFKELTTPLGQQIMRVAKSAEMRSFIDADVNPCDDFDGYACGNFRKINAATEEKDSNFDLRMFDNYRRRVRQLLNEPRISTDRPMELRVKYFYESCLDTAALRTKQRSHLLSVLREFGGMPAVEGKEWDYAGFDALETMAQLLRRYGKLTLLGVYVSPDFSNSQMNRLYLGQRDGMIFDYVYHLRLQLQNLLGLSKEQAEETANEIFELHIQLSRSVLEHGKPLDPRLKNHLTTLSNISEANGPTLNLTRFVSTWLGHEYNLPVYESVPIYLFQLKNILLSTPNHVLANYMLSTLLADFDIDIDKDKQEEICAEKITELFPAVIDHLVYHSLEQQSPHMANELNNLWVELKASFEEMLSSPDLKWLEEQTRKELLEKLKSMSFEIAGSQAVDFEERYGALVVSSADYYGNVQRLLEVKASDLRADLMRESRKRNFYKDVIESPVYITESNMVVLPTAYMQQRYLWDDVYPAAFKYGTLGLLLSHEMARGFDEVNRLFDSKGNLNDSWSPQTKMSFDVIKGCLADQFSGMWYGDRPLPKYESQSVTIADNVGIRIAQAAYWKWLKQLKTQDTESLPHMTQSPEQLFFLSVAQSMCADVNEYSRAAFALDSDYPPNECRVNAMMTNSLAFAEAFHCSNKTHMNPPSKCTMF